MTKRAHRDIEFRFAKDDESGVISGVAARFGEVDSFGDVLKPGAFARSLAEHRARGTMPKMFWSHDVRQVIGVWEEITETAEGLQVRGRLILEVPKAQEVHALMRAGAVDGLSIGFVTRKATRDAEGVRTVADVDLIEVSPVALPAAPRARITSVRNSDRPSAAVATFISAAKAATRALVKG
jgi:uncharacterized protein